MLAVILEIVNVSIFFIIGGILFKAAHADISTKSVENIYPFTILVIALTNNWLKGTPISYLMGLLLAIPFIIAFYLNKFGGADVKLIIALSIYLGFYNSFILIISALVSSLIIELIKRVRTKSKDSYPFVPYLFFGFLVTAMPTIAKMLWS